MGRVSDYVIYVLSIVLVVLLFLLMFSAVFRSLLVSFFWTTKNRVQNTVQLDKNYAPQNGMMPQTTEKTITLSEQNGSGEYGTATLKEVNGKLVVTLSVIGASGVSQPAHIHVGSCPTPGAVKYPLASVVNGKSTTTLNTTLQAVTNSPMAINVHKSASDINTYVACGNVAQ